VANRPAATDQRAATGLPALMGQRAEPRQWTTKGGGQRPTLGRRPGAATLLIVERKWTLSKLNDSDFINYINKYDFLFLTETWHSNTSNIDIDNFLNFSCPRPKCKIEKQNDSGGVVIYNNKKYFGHVKLLSNLIWIKLDKHYFGADNDVYICNCYIPPEDSDVYKSRLSPLFEFDFFEQLLNNISEYEQIGDVILTGDFNSRVGQRSDLIENINLDRFVDMPGYDVPIDCLPPISSFDNQCNSFDFACYIDPWDN